MASPSVLVTHGRPRVAAAAATELEQRAGCLLRVPLPPHQHEWHALKYAYRCQQALVPRLVSSHGMRKERLVKPPRHQNALGTRHSGGDGALFLVWEHVALESHSLSPSAAALKPSTKAAMISWGCGSYANHLFEWLA